MISSHLTTIQQRVRVTLVDPTNRRIEGTLPDGATIMVSVWEVPPTFTWPMVGEMWTAIRSQGNWKLGARIEAVDEPQSVELLQPGQTRIDGTTVVDRHGRTLATVCPRVTSLPELPEDGDECYYVADAANGVNWHLRYNALSTSPYKWESVGGPALGIAADVDTDESTTSTVYVDLTTVGPTVTVPLAGEYDISYGANAYGTNSDSFASLRIGATAPVDADGVLFNTNAAGAQTGTRARRKTIPLAATVVKVQYRAANATGEHFRYRWMRLQPIRVG